MGMVTGSHICPLVPMPYWKQTTAQVIAIQSRGDSDRPPDGLTSSQLSAPNASHRKELGHWKPNLLIRGSQPDLTCSQSRLQGGFAFRDTHLGT